MANNTPALNATGSYKLKSPFTLNESAVYVAESINGFEALAEQGIDIYETLYRPNGLSAEIYDQDALDGINIVTLMSKTEATVHVPSSYILSFPSTGAIPYSQTILSFDIGAVPDILNLDVLMADVKEKIAAAVGTNVRSNIHLLPVLDEVDYTAHQQLENARYAAMELNDSYYVQLLDARERIASLEVHIKNLEEVIE